MLPQEGGCTQRSQSKFPLVALFICSQSQFSEIPSMAQPENLLLDSNGLLKISDFGLSALHNTVNEGMTLTSSKFLHTTCGSPNYVSPEVIDSEGCGYDGRKADIWSMGVILYVMSTGCLPFDEKSMPDLFSKIRSAKYRQPKGISNDLIDLISKILIADPKQRISIDDIQQHSWYVGKDAAVS